MGNFTKKKLKSPKEYIEGLKKGEISITKRKFDFDKSKKTFKKLSKDGKKLKSKVDELMAIQGQFNDEEAKRAYIENKMIKRG